MSPGSANSYQEAEILSSTPEQLIPLFFRELLKNLRMGSRHIAEGDLESKAERLGRASAILLELIACLDMSAGELPQQLASLYGYFIREIDDASARLDKERLVSVIEMVSQLEEAWSEAAQQVSGAGVGATGAGP